MALSNWEVALRNLSNRVESTATESKIYITATKTISRDNQRLSATRFRFVFGVTHFTRSDANPTNQVQIYCDSHEFDHPFDRLASPDEAKAVVAAMICSHQIPFSFGTERGKSLHWKEVIAGDTTAVERVPLQGFDDIITRISQAAACVAREASASGRRAVRMAVTIDQRTTIPHQEFERSSFRDYVGQPRFRDPENPRLHRWIIRIHTILCLVAGQSLEDDGDVDQTELTRNLREFVRAIQQSFSQSAEAFESEPASKSTVEALEKFRYERSSEDDDESNLMTCMICMEEAMIGSYLTRMPCSHVYHFDCISQWLHINHTCPICRFKLPTQ
ncbi:hypothetical protein TIFTF001_032087 [Ficus carica]|uniref:RING-type E3 ubiquitin transferase n=1 Tax=Ficus carica TaxID=3494 RepID=A0AA88DWT6_FICCA|nr:hypothetical protein TIFTF001_032087 [Ficus carica]